MNEKIKSLFEDLGKPTLRGIRKCPKCGTYNGTRGMTCKNKSCKAVFKEAKEPPKTQAVKIISLESQIYSVKVQDKNPDTWGFVQLPLIEGLSLLQRTPEVELIFQSAAQCYVESCQKSNEDIPELSLSVNTCQHVSAALSTTREAKQLVVLKNTVFNLLPISKEMKEELWKLITETPEPLIQRISKNCMVVKCKPDSQHPLGFLHVRIYNRHNRGSAFRYRMICDCESFELSKARFWKNDNHCIHYYACMSAFASDKKLSKEFKGFLMMANIDKPAIQNVHASSPKRKISILESAANDSEIALKILLIDDVHASMKKKENSSGSNSNFLLLQDRKTESWMLNDSFAKTLSDTSKKRPGKFSTLAIDESSVALSFISWLASVTERINQTMHFQFDGKPDPLVFHVPQMFFDCLQQRIPSGSKRKSLPHMTCTFERKDALPLGKFSKYTWNICDLLHVKEIFDTPEIALQVTQSFVENRDGTYDPYSPSTDGEQLAEHYKKTGNNLLIKPLELKTFLKVGQVSPDSEEEVPFIIEWIPNLLPKSNIGELHIKFEFGHMRNGRVVIGGPVLFIQELLT